MARQTVLTSFFSPARRLRMRALADGGNEVDDEENGAEDLFVSETLDRLSDANRWPIRRNRVKTFSERDDLHRIRKHFSSRHTHSSVPVEKNADNKEGRQTCCMCGGTVIQQSTRFRCNVCSGRCECASDPVGLLTNNLLARLALSSSSVC